MPKYLIQGSYSDQGLKGLLQEGGSNRPEAVEQSVQLPTPPRAREGMPAKGRVLRRPRPRCGQKPQHPPQPQHSLDRVWRLLRLLRLFQKRGGDNEYGGKFSLAAVQESVLQSLEIARLDQVFTIFPNVDRALGAA